MFDQIRDVSLEAVSALLAFFYALPVVGGNYGLAIMMLTAAVMIVLMPLTLKATRSTIKMTQLQPELKALQKKHKDDRAKVQQEMMALYQANGVNPIGGCLPMLAQLPVFLLLFNVLRGLSRRVSDLPYYTISERAREIATGVPADPERTRTFDPQYLDRDSQLYQDLTQETEIGFGPFDLSERTWDVVQTDVLASLPYLLLILFVVGSSYYQQRQISARRGAVPDNPTPQQQTQQQLLRILPLMSGIWSFLFPTGLVLYWATSNLFRIGQQAYITRALYSEDGEGTKALQATASAGEDEGDGDEADGSGADTGKDSGTMSGSGAPAKGRGSSARNGSSSGSRRAETNGTKRAAASGREDRAGADAAGGSSNGTAADRNEAWARRRAQRTKTRTSDKPSGSTGGGNRVTPKGTKPGGGRKKRKR